MTEKIQYIRDRCKERIDAEVTESTSSTSGGGPAGIDLDFIAECRAKNEVGDSELYCTIHRNKYAKNVDTVNTWYVFNDHHWSVDKTNRSLDAVEDVVEAYLRELADTEAKIASLAGVDNKEDIVDRLKSKKDAIIKRCSRLRTGRGRKNTLDLAASNSNPLIIQYDQMDRDPFLLGVANGVVDLKTGLLRPGRPEDYITITAPTMYRGIEAPCINWQNFLLEVLVDQSVVDYLQRLLGYSIIGTDLGFRVFPIFFGEYSQNGKGTIKDVMFHVLGPLAGVIQSEMLIATKFTRSSSSPTPDIMALKGKRLVFASETEKGQRFATAAVKRYAGGDRLQGRGLQDREFTEFDPTHTMFLLTNYKPHAPAEDRGFFNRTKIIPFPFSFVENPKQPFEKKADTKLKEKLVAEASGILGWLVKGALLFRKMGLATPESIKKPTDEYQRGEDQILDFIEECCDRDPKLNDNATNLYLAFKWWWKINVNLKPPSARSFGDGLTKHHKKEKKGTVTYFGLEVKPDIRDKALKSEKVFDSE